MSDKFFKVIKENDIKFVDFRFTDSKGKWQHTCMVVEAVTEDIMTEIGRAHV